MNVPYLLAAIVSTVAVSLHVYTFEVWIWPKLSNDGFGPTPFGGPDVTKGLYRVVWHFFTVSWLGTIVAMLVFAFGDAITYANLFANVLLVYWIVITLVIFIVGALNLQPGQSYIKVMLKAFQWTLTLLLSFLIYWGTQQ